jgi:hypothetical protein
VSNNDFTRPADTQPAFPRDHAHDGHNGMSLRDYFAAKAMQAYIGTYPCPAAEDNEPQPNMGDVAADAYEMADAMLKARQQ